MAAMTRLSPEARNCCRNFFLINATRSIRIAPACAATFRRRETSAIPVTMQTVGSEALATKVDEQKFGYLSEKDRLIDEMENKCFWALTTREREYYEQPKSGCEEIIARFPDLLSDVEEASKCFAMGIDLVTLEVEDAEGHAFVL